MGYQSTQWGSIEDCFRDICNFGVRYKRAKGYYRAEFDTPEASTVNEVNSTKNPGLCFKCRGPYFQNRCTKHRNQASNRSQSISSHSKITTELIIHRNSMTVKRPIVYSLWEPYYSNPLNKSSLAMTYHLALTQLNTFLEK